MIKLSIFIEISENNVVTRIHYMPFDEKDGLGKSETELLQDGKLIDSIPAPTPILGKQPVYYYDESNNSVYIEYVDRPLTPNEELEKLKTEDLNNKEAIAELYIMSMGGV